LKGYQPGPGVGIAAIGLMLLAALNLLKLFTYILMVAVFAQAILSFIAPRGPATSLLASLTRPFLGVFQRRIPPIGGVDLSPLFVLVICQIVLMWPLTSLELAVTRML
jgi:YggT family protein